MERKTDNKIVLVTAKTRYENLIYRYNTESQAKFYIESRGGDFEDYKIEHTNYRCAVNTAVEFLESYAHLQIIDRENVPNYIFGKNDLVIVIGRDGLAANVLKYLTTQKLIGVNPDQKRWDGVLLPFTVSDLRKIVPETFKGLRSVKSVTIASAELNDGQSLYGVNDLFIGQRTHTSARYQIDVNGKKENQSSSGIIVSTGLGSTGWLKSIIAGVSAIDDYCQISSKPKLPKDFSWDSNYLYFTVREPYPSKSTGANIVFGKIEKNSPMKITSLMAENGVIFSDGVEQDYLQFNSGTSAIIGISDKKGSLVV